MSVHRTPIHRPFHPSEHRFLMTLLTLAVLAVVIVALIAVLNAYPVSPAVISSMNAAERARLEFRRGEWDMHAANAVYDAEQARLEFRRGEWSGQ